MIVMFRGKFALDFGLKHAKVPQVNISSSKSSRLTTSKVP